MQISIVATLCHSLAAIPAPVCREEIVIKDEMPMQACFLSQPALAEWKSRSIYRSEAWFVMRIKCVSGEYVLRDSI